MAGSNCKTLCTTMRPPPFTILFLFVVLGAPVASLHSSSALLFHKPVGCVVTHADNKDLPSEKQRPTVFDLLPHVLTSTTRWHACGRLDLKTSGLLLLTTDGALVHAVTNPTQAVPIRKTYRALCMGILGEHHLQRLRDGVDLAGGLGMSAPAEVTLEGHEGRAKSRLRISICEGKNRQIRRMLHAIHSGVLELERVSSEQLP